MKATKIRKKRRKFLKKVKKYQDKLVALTKVCKHKNTKKSLYMWRAGSTIDAMICEDCGEVVKNLSFSEDLIITSTGTFDGVNNIDVDNDKIIEGK